MIHRPWRSPTPDRHRPCRTFALIVLAAIFPLSALGEDVTPPEGDTSLRRLVEMSLEELADIQITSVARRPEKRRMAASAIYVITPEDIRRSTATTVPELLRGVPGLHVARMDASKWVVSSRGLDVRYSGSLLVLIDGRSVYSPLFAGVNWELRDVVLEDVERIEVIRGPGGALWGANAVNGVINIITKSAAGSQGGLLTLGGGTEERGFATFRYGAPAGRQGHFRIYGKASRHDDGVFPSGKRSDDGWTYGRAGGRYDGTWDEDHFTLQGDIYGADISQTYSLPMFEAPYRERLHDTVYNSGGNILGRWTRTLANESELSLQTYFDHTNFNDRDYDLEHGTFDVEFQHRMAARGRHEITWGGGVRYLESRFDGDFYYTADPERSARHLFNIFFQDRIRLADDRLVLTLGSKFEYNNTTGFEVQPNVRLAWTPSDNHTLWAAISRAVRTPSISDSDILVTGAVFPDLALTLYGQDSVRSESLLALEAGYRWQATDQVAIDLAGFFNVYEDLRTFEVGAPFFDTRFLPFHWTVPVYTKNNMRGKSYGVEVGVDWKPKPWWRIRANYTFLEMDLTNNAKTLDIVSTPVEDTSPEQQVYLRSEFSLPKGVELDVALRYVDSLPGYAVKDYLTMDLRAGWRPSDNFELSVVGHDLFDQAHEEYFYPGFTIPTRVQRGVYAKVTWKF